MAGKTDDVGENQPSDNDRVLAVIQPDGERAVQTKLVLMNKAKLPTPGRKGGAEDEDANIQWVLKPIVARRGRKQTRPPSIGSMQIPGKP